MLMFRCFTTFNMTSILTCHPDRRKDLNIGFMLFSCFTTFNMTVKALNNLTCNSDDRKNLNIGFMLYSCFTFNKICMLILLS